ncbi:MAG: metallophosphoesterase family protein [Chloroflexi bacterium]|nr:metallophosphoesterase family protein [Chloroflexota bacterium]
MRILVISDVHANFVALETVLDHAGKVDAVWCLGDVVGYGPSPNECIALLKELPDLVCLIGNHDAAAINILDSKSFNPEARISIEWLKKQLTKESISFLKERPHTESIEQVTLAHGSPRQPVLEYLLDTRSATENFEYFDTDFCFVGHTHLPVIFYISDDDYLARLTIPQANQVVEFKPRAIINPGSVGQPRDRDPRCAYAIFDSQKNAWEYRRIDYDIPKVQQRMKTAGLPERHILRLEEGW